MTDSRPETLEITTLGIEPTLPGVSVVAGDAAGERSNETRADGTRREPPEPDCLLAAVDVDDPRSAVSPTTPVVVVADDPARAIERVTAGEADDWLPRAVVRDDPALARERLATLMDRSERAERVSRPSADSPDDARTTDDASVTKNENETGHGDTTDDASTTEDANAARDTTDDADGSRLPSLVGSVFPEDSDEPRADAFRQLVAGLADGVTIHDPETGELIAANDAYRGLVDADADELLGTAGLSVAGEGYAAAQGVRVIRRVGLTGDAETLEWTTPASDRRIESTLSAVTLGGTRRVVAVSRPITERGDRRRAYEEIFHAANDSIVVHDPDTGRLIDANDTFCELVGYDRDTVIERGVSGVSATAEGYTPERAREVIAETMRTGETGPFEWRVETSDGETRVLEVTATRTEIGGEPRHLSLMRDVTERRQFEETYRELFDTVAATVTVHAPGDPTLRDANRTLCDLLGYDREELIGMDTARITADVAGYDGDRIERVHERAVTSDEPVEVEWPLATREGETRWIEATVTTATIEGTRRVISTGREITEAKRREHEYEQIFDGVQDAISLIDPETMGIVDANEAYLEMLGYEEFDAIKREGVEGLSLVEEGFTLEAGREIHRRVANTNTTETVEWAAETKGGDERYLEVKIAPAEIGGRTLNVTTHRDVTDRRRRERAIRALQRATEQFQTAENREAIAQTAVETASEILDLPCAVCWVHDETRHLEPIAATEAVSGSVADAVGESGTDTVSESGTDTVSGSVADAVGESRMDTVSESGTDGVAERTADATSESATEAVSESAAVNLAELPADRYEYAAFQADRVTTYDDETEPFETTVLMPLGDHGLMVAGSRESSEPDETVLDVASALADHATTALTRIERAEAVRDSERRFRLIADRIDEVIYLASPDFSSVSYVNPAYEEVWGRPVGELYEQPTSFVDAIDERDREWFEREFRSLQADIERGDPADRYEFEFRLRQPDGAVRWVEATGYTVGLPDGQRRYVGVATDVTERKRREQRLEVFNRILRHNLRNRLDVIRAHAETLAAVDTVPDVPEPESVSGDSSGTTELAPDEIAHHADSVVQAADRLSTLGDQARAVDRIMSRERRSEPVDLTSVVAEVVDEQPTDETTIRTELPETARLTTDEETVRTVLGSAIDNAVEYADSEVRVGVTESSEGDGYRVTVADDGPGIPESQLDSLERGSETPLQHGRGLGLWQLRWGVDALNGDVAFETDEGTTVTLWLPDRPTATDVE